jgi:hypothetical protein
MSIKKMNLKNKKQKTKNKKQKTKNKLLDLKKSCKTKHYYYTLKSLKKNNIKSIKINFILFQIIVNYLRII